MTAPSDPVDVEVGLGRVVRVQVVDTRLVLRVAHRRPSAGGGEGLIAGGCLSLPLEAAPALARAVRRVARDAD